MSESLRKFIKGSETIESELSVLVKELRSRAAEHEDFDITIAFMDAIASFKNTLLQSYTEEDLIQIPLYHELIGSGLPQGATFEVPVMPLIVEKVTREIQKFVTTTLSPLLA